MVFQHDIGLEAALGRAVPLIRAGSIAEHPLANGKARHALANGDDLARDVGASNKGVCDPGRHQFAHALNKPVHRIDGDGADADHDLSRQRIRIGGRSDGEVGAFGFEPKGGVVGHGLCSCGRLSGR